MAKRRKIRKAAGSARAERFTRQDRPARRKKAASANHVEVVQLTAQMVEVLTELKVPDVA